MESLAAGQLCQFKTPNLPWSHCPEHSIVILPFIKSQRILGRPSTLSLQPLKFNLMIIIRFSKVMPFDQGRHEMQWKYAHP